MEEDLKNTSGNSASPAPAELLGSLLSHPELMEQLRKIMVFSSPSAHPADSRESNEDTDIPTEKATPSAAQPTFSNISAPPNTDGLAKVLSDPAMLEKLPQIMAVLKPMLASVPASAPAPEQGDSVPAGIVSDHKKISSSERDCLLLALKPFLSPERCAAVDSIIRISKLGLVLKQIK